MSYLLPLLVVLLIEAVAGDVQVFFNNGMGQMVADFQDLPAAFGEKIPSKGLTAYLVYSSPDVACSQIEPPPRNVSNLTKRWAVLIKRFGQCTFEDKVLAAQNASYDIAIIHNVDSDDLKRMHANHPEKIKIPSVFVGERTGLFLKERYLYDKGFLIRISEDSPIDFNTSMLIPFLVVISLCLFTMLGFLVVKYIKDQRRAGRRRLPNSSLKKIPTAKYRKGDPYETCAICLDDYIEGEKLRILPCSHAYHSKCIDPWLTKNRRICPMCKRKVYAAGEVPAPSDSDSGSEEDDQTPLLRSAQQTQGGGTFPFLRALEAAQAAIASSSRGEDLNNLLSNYFQDNQSSSSSFQSIESQPSRVQPPSQTYQSDDANSTTSAAVEDVNPFSSNNVNV